MNSTFIQDHWTAFRNTEWGQDERILYTISFCGIHNVWYWAISLFFGSMYYFDFFPQYKIQKGKYPPRDLVIKSCTELFISQFIANPFLVYYGLFPFLKAANAVDISIQLPSTWTILWQLVFFAAVEDTLFYWSHRMLHHRSIYKYIHKKHHDFKVNTGLVAEYSHPVESIIGVMVPVFTGPLIVKPHLLTITLWIMLQALESINAHSGYRFPWDPFHILDEIQGGSERHDFHHSHNRGSYGSWTTFWDWVMGTDAPYRSSQILTTTEASRKTFVKKSRTFCLNLSNEGDRLIGENLRENLVKFPQDSWQSITLDGKPSSLPKEVPKSGRLRFVYQLIGKNKKD